MNKQNKTKTNSDTENRSLVTRREEDWEVSKRDQMYRDGNQTFGGHHLIVYSDVELQCTTETYEKMTNVI